jgi:hypothetical protein
MDLSLASFFNVRKAEWLVVAMVINTVANHKLHAARTCSSRQRKSSAELEGARR